MNVSSRPELCLVAAAFIGVSASGLLLGGCVDPIDGIAVGSPAEDNEGSIRRDDPFRVARRAARTGDLETLKTLIEVEPAVLEAVSPGGTTLLHEAAWQNQPAVVEYLVAKGLKVDAQDGSGDTPLHRAASEGSLAAAKVLVRLGADPTVRPTRLRADGKPDLHANGIRQMDRTVLSAAAHGGHPEMVAFLLAQGAPVVYGNPDWKQEGWPQETALHWAMISNTDWGDPKQAADRLAVIDLLAQNMDDINVRSSSTAFDRTTALGVAAKHKQPAIVRHLLENYAEIDTGVDLKDYRQLELPPPTRRPTHAEIQEWSKERRAAEVHRLLHEHRVKAAQRLARAAKEETAESP